MAPRKTVRLHCVSESCSIIALLHIAQCAGNDPKNNLLVSLNLSRGWHLASNPAERLGRTQAAAPRRSLGTQLTTGFGIGIRPSMIASLPGVLRSTFDSMPSSGAWTVPTPVCYFTT